MFHEIYHTFRASHFARDDTNIRIVKSSKHIVVSSSRSSFYLQLRMKITVLQIEMIPMI